MKLWQIFIVFRNELMFLFNNILFELFLFRILFNFASEAYEFIFLILLSDIIVDGKFISKIFSITI